MRDQETKAPHFAGAGGGGWCQKEQVKGREEGCLGGVGCDVHILTFLRKRVEVYC